LLQIIFVEALSILKEVFLTLTLGQCPLKIWVIIANITNKFFLGLDILCTYDASVDQGHQTLYLSEEGVSLWSPRVGIWPSSLVVARYRVKPNVRE
jgi:hypothetical protein